MKSPLKISSVWILISLAGCAALRPKPQFRAEKDRVDTTNTISLVERRMIEEIRSFLGTPYVWGGSTKKGSDCSGFVMAVFDRAIGIKLPHSTKEMYKLGSFVHLTDLRLGDLVFFKNIENPGLSHVGIYIADTKFAHASLSRGVTISSLSEDYYKERFIGAKRIVPLR